MTTRATATPGATDLLAIPDVAWPTIALALASVAAFVALALGASSGVIAWWVATPLQGLLAFVAFTPMHDASHRSVTRVSLANELVGWLCGVVLLAPFPAFRYVHLEHHRHTNDAARDPDMWSGGGPGWQRLLRWATQDFYYYAWYARRLRERPRREVAATLLGFGVTYGPLVALIVMGHAREALLFWAIPARIGIVVLAFAFDWLPHHPHAVLGAVDPMRATAVIEHRALTPVLLSQNYHLVHHLYPGVPFYRYGLVWWSMREPLVARGALVRRIGGAAPAAVVAPPELQSLVVLDVVDETPDTKSFLLGVPSAVREAFRARAGQHVTVEVVIDGVAHRRSYSLSRRASHEVVRLSVKRVPGGLVSAHLHERVRPGDTLLVSAPRGRFVRRDGARPLIALAAGSGITPIRALVEETLADTLREVHVFYASRDRDHVIFDTELAALARQHRDRLDLHVHLDAEHGVPTERTLRAFLEPHRSADVYLCGPAPFIALCERALAPLDLAAPDGPRVFIERFVSPGARARRDVKGRAARLRVLRDHEVHPIAVGAGETLLQAARRSGVKLPSSCEDGYCGACTAQLAQGQVAMRCSDALTDADLQSGAILPCQAVPTTAELTITYDP